MLAVLLVAALLLTACGGPATNGDNPIKSAGVLRVGWPKRRSPKPSR